MFEVTPYERGYMAFKPETGTPEAPYEVGSPDANQFYRGYGEAYEEYWESYVPPRNDPPGTRRVMTPWGEGLVDEEGELL